MDIDIDSDKNADTEYGICEKNEDIDMVRTQKNNIDIIFYY